MTNERRLREIDEVARDREAGAVWRRAAVRAGEQAGRAAGDLPGDCGGRHSRLGQSPRGVTPTVEIVLGGKRHAMGVDQRDQLEHPKAHVT